MKDISISFYLIPPSMSFSLSLIFTTSYLGCDGPNPDYFYMDLPDAI